jgi:hypothetical protein
VVLVSKGSLGDAILKYVEKNETDGLDANI